MLFICQKYNLPKLVDDSIVKKTGLWRENLEINEKEGKRKMLIETESCSIKKKLNTKKKNFTKSLSSVIYSEDRTKFSRIVFCQITFIY